jgi:hypothetical protein
VLKKLFIIAMALTTVFPVVAFAQEEENAVRTANYFMWAREGLDYPEHRDALAEYDLLVLPAEAQFYNPDFFADMRSRNPDIIILAYVATTSYAFECNDPLHDDLLFGIQDSYWLKDTNGNQMSIWPNTAALDLTSGWNDYLANFAINDVYGTGYWDGIFYDEVNDGISFQGNAMLANSSGNIDAAWLDANTELFAKTRAALGPNAIIITNGSSNVQHAPYVNGRMFESFPNHQNLVMRNMDYTFPLYYSGGNTDRGV